MCPLLQPCFVLYEKSFLVSQHAQRSLLQHTRGNTHKGHGGVDNLNVRIASGIPHQTCAEHAVSTGEVLHQLTSSSRIASASSLSVSAPPCSSRLGAQNKGDARREGVGEETERSDASKVKDAFGDDERPTNPNCGKPMFCQHGTATHLYIQYEPSTTTRNLSRPTSPTVFVLRTC